MTTSFLHGPSEQTVCTPPELIQAVRSKLGVVFAWDAAASRDNSMTGPGACFTEENSALEFPWEGVGDVWYNPPFRLCGKFVARARDQYYEYGIRSVGLVLASVGSNWWAECVDDSARVLFLRPRVTFVEHTNPFMKDLALVCYGLGRPGYECWKWK